MSNIYETGKNYYQKRVAKEKGCGPEFNYTAHFIPTSGDHVELSSIDTLYSRLTVILVLALAVYLTFSIISYAVIN